MARRRRFDNTGRRTATGASTATSGPSGGRGTGRPGRGGRNGGRRATSAGLYAPPPPGTYDPGLDALVRQSRRGLADQRQDTEREQRFAEQDLHTELKLNRRDRRRALRDLNLALERGQQDIAEDLARGIEDLDLRRGEIEQQYQRDVQDLAIARTRGGEDYDRALETMQRRYGTMASVQAESAAAAGVRGGGFAEQSAAKRAGNQAFEREGVDTANRRLNENLDIRGQRGSEDRERALAELGLSEGRLREDVAVEGGRLSQDYNRGTKLTTQDTRTANQLARRGFRRDTRTRNLDLSRAVREQGIYETDQTQQAYYQASQNDPSIQFPTLQQIRHRRRRNH